MLNIHWWNKIRDRSVSVDSGSAVTRIARQTLSLRQWLQAFTIGTLCIYFLINTHSCNINHVGIIWKTEHALHCHNKKQINWLLVINETIGGVNNVKTTASVTNRSRYPERSASRCDVRNSVAKKSAIVLTLSNIPYHFLRHLGII